MKTVFDYKKELIMLDKPEKEIEKLFEEICKLLESWNIDPNNVKIYQCNPVELKTNFNETFLEKFICSALGIDVGNLLWNNLFKITKVENYSHYEDIITYNMELESKFERVRKISGTWVYENYKQVESFLDANNPIYVRLVTIKRLFPIQVL